MPRKSNPDVRKAFEQIPITIDQINELHKCAEDPIYCIKNYFKIKHPTKGLVKFDLYEYQEEVIRRAQKNRFNIILFPRQSGKCNFASVRIFVRENKEFTFFQRIINKVLLWLIN